MHHIAIIAVGRLKERYLAEGVELYLKRISPYARVTVIEVPEGGGKGGAGAGERAVEAEGSRILSLLSPGTYTVALDPRGKALSSEEMAAVISGLAAAGRSHISFVIGGAYGLSPAVLEKASLRLSLSKLTFTHQMARLLLLEQLYRWFKIARGEPYHH